MHYCYRITISPSITPNSVTYSGIRPNSVKIPIRNYGSGSLLRVKASINNNSNNSVSTKSESTLYEVLGIPESVSREELKHAYKQVIRKCHPDLSPPGRVEEYTKRFIMVREAYEMLSDPVTRAIYDRDLAKGIQFVFSTCRHHHDVHNDQVSEEKKEWKSGWETQLWELKRRSDWKEESRGNMSWSARMRQRS